MRRLELVFLFAWTAVTAGFVFADVPGGLRTALSLTWLSLAPGLAFTRLIGLSGLTIRLVIAIPVSLALAAIVSAVLVYARLPSWELGMSVLVSICVAILIAHLAPPRLATSLLSGPPDGISGKLSEEGRQARLVDSLLGGATLHEAANAAGISFSTLQRAMRRSDQLRRAVDVASRTGYRDVQPEP
jgi:hypothetical protein